MGIQTGSWTASSSPCSQVCDVGTRRVSARPPRVADTLACYNTRSQHQPHRYVPDSLSGCYTASRQLLDDQWFDKPSRKACLSTDPVRKVVRGRNHSIRATCHELLIRPPNLLWRLRCGPGVAVPSIRSIGCHLCFHRRFLLNHQRAESLFYLLLYLILHHVPYVHSFPLSLVGP